MPIPEITLSPAAPLPNEVFSLNGAAVFLGTGRSNVAKIKGAGYLADLTFESLKLLRLADFVSAGGQLPLIQTAPAEEAHEPLGWRTWYGDAPHLSDQEWLDAQRGDWTGASAPRIVQAGYLGVGLGGLITGVAKVIRAVDSGDGRKARFELQLLGRLTSDVRTGAMTFPEGASVEDRNFAKALVGKRYEPKAGGSVMWL